ncbi:hypothetical protein BDF14DRAFT_1740717 [Spinellus fusiger]|nr:hypothetical protein BDF14DRAFT_1740717 [Spinellus fusiger]
MAEAYKEAPSSSSSSNIVVIYIVRDVQLPAHPYTHINSTTYHPLKKVTNSPNRQFMPVKTVPLNLFLDDTSDNTTKKWNKFESCMMSLTAMLYKEQYKVENLFFVCTSNKLSITEMLPELVKDLEALEKGMEMFDVKHGEPVVVVGVVHFLMADNPMHVAVACSLGASANLPCRKCYWVNNGGDTTVEQEGVDGNTHTRKRKEDLVEMCQYCDSNPSNASLRSNSGTGYKLTGSEALLSLELWDPTMDYPVEILHTILLGVAKHLVIGMVPFYTEKEVKHLEENFHNYHSKAFIRKHCTPFCLCESYLGRDFKIIIQQMPIILCDLTQRRLISNNDSKAIILYCFVKLGLLVSLLYMQDIEACLDMYVDKVVTGRCLAMVVSLLLEPMLSYFSKYIPLFSPVSL